MIFGVREIKFEQREKVWFCIHVLRLQSRTHFIVLGETAFERDKNCGVILNIVFYRKQVKLHSEDIANQNVYLLSVWNTTSKTPTRNLPPINVQGRLQKPRFARQFNRFELFLFKRQCITRNIKVSCKQNADINFIGFENASKMRYAAFFSSLLCSSRFCYVVVGGKFFFWTTVSFSQVLRDSDTRTKGCRRGLRDKVAKRKRQLGECISISYSQSLRKRRRRIRSGRRKQSAGEERAEINSRDVLRMLRPRLPAARWFN